MTQVPEDFRAGLLAKARWRRFSKGEQFSLAGYEGGELIGLVGGYVAFKVSFGLIGSG